MTPFRSQLAVRHLRNGGILAYPTEAVYGLGCDPLNADAVERLLALKQRHYGMGLILIAAAMEQLGPYIQPLDADTDKRLQSSWPGPVTWILPAQIWVPPWLTGASHELALRVTAHPGCVALCKAFGGPLISTSANPHGSVPAKTAHRTRRYFPHADLHFFPGNIGELQYPTRIIHAQSGRSLR
ncbi:Sua5/YciO/YrdC/YwlC family protein [Candidatus Methylospira mobilis]|uniref:L-threonylcarbamoyladenylate synthase n=1 Tax=Candidatus Methylospira mobilis TaxID=1808979 RepID=UPI001D175848|nr:Sua5/YciO/YrdC/YwlC family protein [Candidatus Methylospira mobilis]WNV06223.1 Sua5/YciO/YrdC/YwlC family protein [Candidatus Methylospira mobilis]